MENLCTQQVLASFCYNNLKVNIYPKKKKKEKTKLKSITVLRFIFN